MHKFSLNPSTYHNYYSVAEIVAFPKKKKKRKKNEASRGFSSWFPARCAAPLPREARSRFQAHTTRHTTLEGVHSTTVPHTALKSIPASLSVRNLHRVVCRGTYSHRQNALSPVHSSESAVISGADHTQRIRFVLSPLPISRPLRCAVAIYHFPTAFPARGSYSYSPFPASSLLFIYSFFFLCGVATGLSLCLFFDYCSLFGMDGTRRCRVLSMGFFQHLSWY